MNRTVHGSAQLFGGVAEWFMNSAEACESPRISPSRWHSESDAGQGLNRAVLSPHHSGRVAEWSPSFDGVNSSDGLVPPIAESWPSGLRRWS